MNYSNNIINHFSFLLCQVSDRHKQGLLCPLRSQQLLLLPNWLRELSASIGARRVSRPTSVLHPLQRVCAVRVQLPTLHAHEHWVWVCAGARERPLDGHVLWRGGGGPEGLPGERGLPAGGWWPGVSGARQSGGGQDRQGVDHWHEAEWRWSEGRGVRGLRAV